MIGFLIRNDETAVRAVARSPELDRRVIWERDEERVSSDAIARRCEQVDAQVLAQAAT